MAPYRKLNQKYVAPNDGHDDVSQKWISSLPRSNPSFQKDQYLPSAHSHNGTLCISLPGVSQPTDSRVIAAIDEPKLASEFPFQRDMNTGDTVRFILILLPEPFFYWFSFPETDRRWVDTGHH